MTNTLEDLNFARSRLASVLKRLLDSPAEDRHKDLNSDARNAWGLYFEASPSHMIIGVRLWLPNLVDTETSGLSDDECKRLSGKSLEVLQSPYRLRGRLVLPQVMNVEHIPTPKQVSIQVANNLGSLSLEQPFFLYPAQFNST